MQSCHIQVQSLSPISLPQVLSIPATLYENHRGSKGIVLFFRKT